MYKNVDFYDKIPQISSNISMKLVLVVVLFFLENPKVEMGLMLGWKSYFCSILPK